VTNEPKTTHHEATLGTKHLVVVKNLKAEERILLIEGGLQEAFRLKPL
jgi:hypothetical protein